MADTQEQLLANFDKALLRFSTFRDNHRVVVSPETVTKLLSFLKQSCDFDLLIDITAVDYLHYPKAEHRFGLIYNLICTDREERLFVKTWLDEPDLTIPSAVPLWTGANWMEREVFDMFGIVFEDHPDLRRILLPDAFSAYPLRKDYPLRGRGDRHNFQRITRAES